MSKMRKPKQKKMNSARRGVIKAFNITVPDELCLPIMVDITSLHSITDEVNQLNEQVIRLQNMASSPQKSDVESSILKAFATIATNAWRAKSKMVDPDTGEAKVEMKRVYRHIEAIYESLKQIGVETIDPVGRVYDSGMALRVITFEPTPGLLNEEIKETIKPSVAWQGRLIQIGEVIVGTPQTK